MKNISFIAVIAILSLSVFTTVGEWTRAVLDMQIFCNFSLLITDASRELLKKKKHRSPKSKAPVIASGVGTGPNGADTASGSVMIVVAVSYNDRDATAV